MQCKAQARLCLSREGSELLLSLQVINFENAAGDNSCLSIENQASCQSSEVNGSNIILNEGSTICVWQNAMLQTCWTSGTTASADQQWVYDNTTKLIALATNPSENVCLEMCTDNSFANSACSLTADNVGTPRCQGSKRRCMSTAHVAHGSKTSPFSNGRFHRPEPTASKTMEHGLIVD